MAVWSVVKVSALSPDMRLDAEYYKPNLLDLDRQLAGMRARPWGDLAGRFIVGPFGSDFNVENFVEESSYRYIRGKDVKPFFLQDNDNAYIPEQFYSGLKKYAVSAGDLLVSVVGTLGHCAVVTEDVGESVFSCKSTAWRPDHGLGDFSLYLTAYLNSRIGQSFLQRLPRGHIQTGLNLADLKSIPIVEPAPGHVKQIGAMVRGALNARRDAKNTLAAAEALLLSALRLDHLELSPSLSYSRTFKDLLTEGRFDAEFFHPRSQAILKQLRRSGMTIGDVAPLAERIFRPERQKKGGTLRYIEIGSLTGVGEAEPETIDVAEAPSRAQFIVRPGDIITSTVRPIRRLSALIRSDQDGCVCSSGFAVLSPRTGDGGIEPEVLLAYLRLPIVCEILDLYCTASMYPAIPVDRLIKVPVVVPEKRVRAKIVEHVSAALYACQESARLLGEAKATIERAILQG